MQLGYMEVINKKYILVDSFNVLMWIDTAQF